MFPSLPLFTLILFHLCFALSLLLPALPFLVEMAGTTPLSLTNQAMLDLLRTLFLRELPDSLR